MSARIGPILLALLALLALAPAAAQPGDAPYPPPPYPPPPAAPSEPEPPADAALEPAAVPPAPPGTPRPALLGLSCGPLHCTIRWEVRAAVDGAALLAPEQGQTLDDAPGPGAHLARPDRDQFRPGELIEVLEWRGEGAQRWERRTRWRPSLLYLPSVPAPPWRLHLPLLASDGPAR